MSLPGKDIKKELESAATQPISAAASAAAPTVLATSAAQAEFNIEDIPFYRAVALFEKEDYQAALPLFLQLSEQCNLLAVYYLHFLVNKKALGLTFTEEQQKVIKRALEYFEFIPKEFQPDAWFKASSCIIRFNKAVAAKARSAIASCISELSALSEHASNAAAALIKYYASIKLKARDIKNYKEIGQKMMQRVDLFAIHYVIQNNLDGGKSNTHRNEWKYMNKYRMLALRPGVLLEVMITKEYNGEVLAADLITKKPSAFGKDLYRKRHWQVTASLMGNRDIQFMWGMSRSSNSIENERQLWLLWAALNKEPQAQMLIVEELFIGTPNYPKNLPRVREFLENILLKQNDSLVENYLFFSRCLFMFAQLHEYGLCGYPKNNKLAFEYYQKAALLKNIPAQYYVASFYQRGLGGLKKNYQIAEQYYNKAIELYTSLEHTLSLEHFGRMHFGLAIIYQEGGNGVEQDAAKAAKHAKIASENFSGALGMYALMLYDGRGVEADPKEAIKLMIKAANNGHVACAFEVAKKYLSMPNPEALGISETCLLQYLLLAKKDNPYAISMLALFHKRRNELDKAYPYLKEGETLNQLDSLLILGGLHEVGCPELKIPKDEKTAFEYYSRAANLGAVEGLHNKAYFILKGKGGVEKNEAAAKKIFEQALADGHLFAAYNLSRIYDHGFGVEKDPVKAFEYLKQAEPTEDEDVCWDLAVCYAKGHGVETDSDLALEYMEKAAKLGHSRACYYYVWNVFVYYLHHHSIDQEHYKVLDDYLEIPCRLNYSAAIFLRNMLLLFVDTNQKQTVIAKLTEANRIKPYKKYALALALLVNKENDVYLKLLILIYQSVNSVKEIDDIIRQNEKSESRENEEDANNSILETIFAKSSTSVNSASTSASSATALATVAAGTKTAADKIITEKQNNAANSRGTSKVSNFVTKLISSLSHFNEQNLKGVNFRQFHGIIKKVIGLPGVTGKIFLSKGSNISYEVSMSSKTLCFSYHPTHARNQKKDAVKDLNRNQSLQSFAAAVQSSVTEMLVSAADENSSAAIISRPALLMNSKAAAATTAMKPAAIVTAAKSKTSNDANSTAATAVTPLATAIASANHKEIQKKKKSNKK